MTENKKNSTTNQRRYLGDILVDSGLISPDQLSEALNINKATAKKVGQILIEMGLVDDREIASALADQLSIPLIDLTKIDIPEDVIKTIPIEIVKVHLLIPVAKDRRSVTIAMANPLDMFALDDARFATQLSIDSAIGAEQDIIAAIGKYYPDAGVFEPVSLNDPGIQNMVVYSDRAKEETSSDKDDDLLNLSDKPPVVRFTNAILSDAIKLKASDIHVEPRRKSVLIRYRVDGIMREIMQTDRQIHSGIVTRIKVLSSMDISERRTPQDGKFQVQHAESRIDFRVSTLPTSYGEKITMRILNTMNAPDSIDKLNFADKSLEHLRQAISKPQGMVLVTGPTGSGKTTTLYTCLKSLMSAQVNIITLENPIEYEIEGINQVEINPKQGLNFANGLRSILRQDPDIVLVGEIRDEETARIAFHAAQTGHLVLSTLHTNSALATLSRLEDLGIEPYNISTTLNAVVSQRLVRRLCENCKQEQPMDNSLMGHLPPSFREKKSLNAWTAEGCENCNSTGFTGRLGIHEVFHINSQIQEMIIQRKNIKDIERAAVLAGYRDLSSDGILKALNGETTLSEVYRVAPYSDEGLVEIDELEIQEPDAADDSDMPVSVESIKPQRILLVDDELFMLQFLKGALEGEGFLITTAQDGLEGLKVAQREIPDLVIADFNMPKMNGVQLIRKLKSNLSTSYIPIMIVTGVDEVDSEIEGLNSGADDYLVKPINVRKLIARVNRLMKRQSSN